MSEMQNAEWGSRKIFKLETHIRTVTRGNHLSELTAVACVPDKHMIHR